MASEEELLGGKRFDALEPAELAQLYRLMSRLELATPVRRTGRRGKGRHGQPSTCGGPCGAACAPPAIRPAGPPAPPPRRRRLVMLCDISGSMEPYARAYLQFLTSAAGSGPNAEAFVFATRLTRLTRALASRHPERAIQRAAAAAPDWSSGTRIGDALKTFNDRHGRRGMARGAVVVILSDGWERGDPMLVGREMERLARLAHRIVWVNPRVSASAFSVQAGGMVAALPHCDALVSGHSFEALGEVVDAIGAPRRPPARRDAAEPPSGSEPWASATPVPGSSVAMPSGHGPSRGKTTPGWSSGCPTTSKTCIYPGLRAAGGAAAPAGRPPARLLRPGGAQRAERPPGAPAPRIDDQARRRGGAVVADEAYRAVFLRVHPTGKMVLSLTTDSDGKEPSTRQLVAARARRAGARRQGRPRRHRPLRRRSRLQHEPVRRHAGGDRERQREDPRQGAAARGHGARRRRPRASTWSNGAWVAGDGSDPAQVKTIEDLALYAHGTGALPPGVEGGLDAQTVYRD